MCASEHFLEGEFFRVTQDDYEVLAEHYYDDFECKSEIRETPVCMCAPGALDILCATVEPQSCYANITKPASFYEGCTGEDSAYYMYSLQGYAPCQFFDFSQVYEIEVVLNCQLFVQPSVSNDTNTTNVTA